MPRTDPGTSEDLLAELSAWVRLETPTTDASAVNRLMDVAEADLARAGAAITRIPGRDGFGDTLIARTPGDGPPVMVAGHLDTVWSLGTLDGMPYRGERQQGARPRHLRHEGRQLPGLPRRALHPDASACPPPARSPCC